MRGIGAEALGEAQDAEGGHHDFIAAGYLLEEVGDLVAVNARDGVEIGQVCDRALVLYEGKALAVEVCIERARVADLHLDRG